ncbi:hypothetical protein LSAT2_008691 [Lamellibrachia satsuma]|nr:hypothetical protein LSAT2_008691 [Lamellibrachia satsuma]
MYLKTSLQPVSCPSNLLTMRSKLFVCICCLAIILSVLNSGHAHALKADVRGYRSGEHRGDRIIAIIKNATLTRKKRKTMDCGKHIPPSYMCCGGWLQYKKPRYNFDTCCDKMLINSKYNICCDGVIQSADNANACCGDNSYHTDHEFCCFGQLYPKRDYDSCCGTQAYNIYKSICCYGRLKNGSVSHFPRGRYTREKQLSPLLHSRVAGVNLVKCHQKRQCNWNLQFERLARQPQITSPERGSEKLLPKLEMFPRQWTLFTGHREASMCVF